MENNRNPLVSIVMNCYNGEKFLHRSLKSVLDQTYDNWELIFWDNASTDNSKQILESYNEPRFKYFRSNENVTLGQARVWAVESCQGKYVSFLDVDDEWLPEKLEKQVWAMENDDYVMCCGGVCEVNEDDHTKRRDSIIPRTSGFLFEVEMFNFDLNLPTAFIRISALHDKGLNFDPFTKASEDVCLFLQLIYDEKVCIIPEVLANYYVRTDSLTNKYIDRWAIERNYTHEKILERHPEAKDRYPKAWNEAEARVAYYQARYLMSLGKRSEARKTLEKVRSVRSTYLIMYLMLFFPSSLWNFVIRVKYMR